MASIGYPVTGPAYAAQRAQLETYFDRTARETWVRLTSDAPVSRIRATVRAGRDAMRATLLGWLPADLRRRRVLDAGCGTGALAVEVACRGAGVTAIDVAGGLIEIARERAPGFVGHGTIDWRVGDMADAALGEFDHVVAMDSLVHYDADAIVAVVAGLAQRTRHSLAFTFAPRTPALAAMHAVGRWFPRTDRAPMIQPVEIDRLRVALDVLPGWRVARDAAISSGFYKSHALELVRR
jgi:magnesium-protoporphyrin O-methyltransferase